MLSFLQFIGLVKQNKITFMRAPQFKIWTECKIFWKWPWFNFFKKSLVRQLMLKVRSEWKLTLASSWGRTTLYINTPLVIHADASSCDVWITNRATESLGQNSLDSMVWFSCTLKNNKPTLTLNVAECRFSTNSHRPSTQFAWSIYWGLRNLTESLQQPQGGMLLSPPFWKRRNWGRDIKH